MWVLGLIGGVVTLGINAYAINETYKTYKGMYETLQEMGEAAVALEKVKMQQYLIMLLSGFVSVIAAAVIYRSKKGVKG